MAVNQQRKKAMKRLMFDQEELNNSPVENVSAAPLDSNMLEWHCNFRHDDVIYHLIMNFPEKYPYDSPSAEFVPAGFRYNSGATKPGKKGTKVCLNIFSDFADIHTEWKDQKGLGWSPGYSVQTVLMNVVAFLAETQQGDWAWMKDATKVNKDLSMKYTCADCGHTYKKPYPPFISGPPKLKKQSSSITSGRPQIIDYMSKDKYKLTKPKSSDELYGYGLIVSGPDSRPSLTSPCEFLTAESFNGMKKAIGKVQSVMKEEVKYFLPLYIAPVHGEHIKDSIEKTMNQLAALLPKCNPAKTTAGEMMMKVIPNLMSATVVEFSKGTQHTSDNSLNGYFALHRLFLWAVETYPEIADLIENKLKVFIEDETVRTKGRCPHIGEWMMLLAGSAKYRWKDAADAYLYESWRRNVMWYVKEDVQLGFIDTDKKYRLEQTLVRTAVSRKLLAFQVLFLDIAMPEGKTRKDLIKRYDENLGFPNPDMVKKMKEAVDKINNMKTYADWFKILKIPVLSDDEVYDRLVEAVKFAIRTNGYNWTFWKDAGGWPQVLKKYKPGGQKIPTFDTEKGAAGDAGGKGKGKGKGKKSAEPEPAEPEPAKDTGKGKGKGKKTPAAPKGRGRGRGKAAAAAAAEESESEEEMEVVKPAGKGRGRGVKRSADEAVGKAVGRGGKRKR